LLRFPYPKLHYPTTLPYRAAGNIWRKKFNNKKIGAVIRSYLYVELPSQT
jgi:hypothetical protein